MFKFPEYIPGAGRNESLAVTFTDSAIAAAIIAIAAYSGAPAICHLVFSITENYYALMKFVPVVLRDRL